MECIITKKVVTIYDIARRAGVSPATVSRVMNRPEIVAAETLKKVRAVMNELSYVPDMVAAGMSRRRTNYIGLIISDITNTFFSQLVRSIQDESERFGYNVIVVNTDDDPEKERNYVKFLYSRRVDGIIVTAAGHREERYTKEEIELMRGMRIVLIDREITGVDAPIIKVRNFQGAYDICKYVIECGHSNIMYIRGIRGTRTDRDRRDGCLAALRETGVKELIEIDGEFRLDVAYREVLKYWRTAEKFPTVIFAANDIMAIGAIKALNEMGVKVPEDVSIVGFDNIPFSECVHPPLTTVSQPIRDIGKISVELLVKKIEGGNTPQFVELGTEIVKRGSLRKL